MTDASTDPIRADSRTWTGQGQVWRPSWTERRVARDAFLRAAGKGAAVPRRIAAAICMAGLPLVAVSVIGNASNGRWRVHPDRTAGWIATMLRQGFGRDGGTQLMEWLVAFRMPVLLLALVASAGGAIAAWRHRVALARGAVAAIPVAAGAADGAGNMDALSPLIFMALAGAWQQSSILTAPALWCAALLLSGRTTVLAGKLFAARVNAQPAGWIAAGLAVIVTAMIALIAGFA